MKSVAFFCLVTCLATSGLKAEEEALKTAVEAYLYGYPLVLMDVIKRVETNVPFPQNGRAPVNQFAHVWEFAAAEDMANPNIDTLESRAWIELAKEPLLLDIPEMHHRWQLITFYDAWGNPFYSLERSDDTNEAVELLIGGKGEGVQAPTERLFLLIQTQCNGTAKDYAIVNGIQQRLSLRPLSADKKGYKPPLNSFVGEKVDARTPPVEQVKAMNAETYFSTMARLMKAYPPAEKMTFELDPKVLEHAVVAAQTKLTDSFKNGWSVHLSNKKGDYLQRAMICRMGLGNNLPPHIVSFYTEGEDQENSHYRLHFEKEQLPPVNALWSLTLYRDQKRYSLNSLGKLKFNEDGSLDLELQRQEPSSRKHANWLPLNKGKFQLVLKLYHPKETVLKGSWSPPLLK